MLELKIDNFTHFAIEQPLCTERRSTPLKLHGFEWRLSAVIIKPLDDDGNFIEDSPERYLGVHLRCAPISKKRKEWSCQASGKFRLKAQMEGKRDLTDQFSKLRVFDNKHSNWGFRKFIKREVFHNFLRFEFLPFFTGAIGPCQWLHFK